MDLNFNWGRIVQMADYKSSVFDVLGSKLTYLSEQDIEPLTIEKSGKYKVYLMLMDEFFQISLWCITNKAYKFNAI